MPELWRVHAADPIHAGRLADACRIDPLTAQFLLNRGVSSSQEAARFLEPSLDTLGDPGALPDMGRAVARLRRAIDEREPILIFGDSDVDGLTASTILCEALRQRGAIVRARHSNRITEGYGLPEALARRLGRATTRVLILVDCGTNQPDLVRQLAERGIDTIIVDHHVPLEPCAAPWALVNPHRRDASSGRELCSAGLALKVAQALGDGDLEGLEGFLDLAALGTLADCAPLTGENRIIVTEGLPRLIDSARPGLRRLCEAVRLSAAEPEPVIKRLIPKLNASGRLGDPSAVWNLLGKECGRLEEWMTEAEAAHTTTKTLHRRILGEAQAQVSRMHFRDHTVLIVSSTGWHQGLMGPLASQLAQRYGRPAIAIALNGRQGTGSARSIPRFNLLEMLHACQDLLMRFGGHAQACGLTVEVKDLEPFRSLINQRARQMLGRDGLVRSRAIDVELPLEGVTARWVEELKRLAPFGQGNPRPTVVIRRLAVTNVSARTAVLSDGHRRVAAKGRLPLARSSERYDVVVSPAMSGGELVLTVSDARGAAAPWGPGRT